MKIHEYQAKEIFRKFNIPVPAGEAAKLVEEAKQVYSRNGFQKVMVKAQVLAGGRGKAGGIKKAASLQEVEQITTSFLGSTLKTYQGGSAGEVIKSVLIEAQSAFDQELYMGIVIDRSLSLPTLIFSEAGGMEIEEVAKNEPHKVIKIPFHPSQDRSAKFFASKLTLSKGLEKARTSLSDICAKLSDMFIKLDCSLIEINPLVVQSDGRALALDAKINFDDNASFRHPEYDNLKDPNEDDPKETRAKKFGLNYISLQGNVGCLVNGAGLAMATMDAIKFAGGEPANFLDVGGGATKEQVQEGFRIMLEDPNVKAILVNIFGGIMKCDVIAQALVDAAKELSMKIPVVVRLEGTNVELGRKILQNSGMKLETKDTIENAAQLVVKLATG